MVIVDRRQMPAVSDALRRMRRLAVFITGTLLVVACSGTSNSPQSATGSSQPGDFATDTTGTTGTAGTADAQSDEGSVVPPLTGIVFASLDGSAFTGSRTILTITDVETGDERLMPVDGADEATSGVAALPPGTYRITAGERHVSPTGSYAVSEVSPAEVTIDADTPVAQVQFALEVQRTPLDLRLDGVTSSTVELSWENLVGLDIARYELRRTTGSAAAASPTDGDPVDLADPLALTATASELQPGTEYSFTLFATTTSGEAVASRAISMQTASLDAAEPAYSLAPNTIVPDDFASLEAEPVGDDRVRITLDPTHGSRGSASEIPGIDPAVLESGCAVGMPVLVSSEVAGDDSFFGLIDACGGQSSGLRSSLRSSAGPSRLSAIVDTKVPLAAVIPFLAFQSTQNHPCIDKTGTKLPADAPLCATQDSDNDGTSDLAAFATEAFGAPIAGAPVPPPTPVEPGTVATTRPGRLEVLLLWTNGDDLELEVTEPAGDVVSALTGRSPGGGRLTDVGYGDLLCPAATPRRERAVWQSNAPPGIYVVRAMAAGQVEPGSPAFCSPAPQAQIQVRLNGALILDETIAVGVDLPTSFIVPPPGDVQAMLTWDTGDDLHLYVTPPGVEVANFYSTVQGYQGALDRDTFYSYSDKGDPFCQSGEPRTEYLSWESGRDPTQPIEGEWSVSVSNDFYYAEEVSDLRVACSTEPVEAHLVVLVRGVVVVDQTITVCDCGDGVQTYDFTDPVPFTVDAAPPAGLRNTLAAARPLVAPAPVPAPERIALECEGEGENTVDLGFGFGSFFNGGAELNLNSFKWDFKTGVTVFVDPKLSTESTYSCEFDIPGVTFQLATKPVPINLEVQPKLGGAVTGRFELTGPRLELGFGFSSIGEVNEEVEWCGWFGMVPCGVGYTSKIDAKPIATFTHGTAEAKLEAELTVSAGMEATIGIGTKNKFVTAKTGFAFDMRPLSEKLKAAAGVSVGLPESTTTAVSPTTTTAPYVSVADRSTLRCAADRQPVDLVFIGEGKSYICPDALCTLRDDEPVYSPFSFCSKARCLANDKVVNANVRQKPGGRPDELEVIESCPPPPGPEAANTIELGPAPPAVPAPEIETNACLAISLGASLKIDFRAEAFVLKWGKDQRYTVWEGDVDYPGAEFALGECPD